MFIGSVPEVWPSCHFLHDDADLLLKDSSLDQFFVMKIQLLLIVVDHDDNANGKIK